MIPARSLGLGFGAMVPLASAAAMTASVPALRSGGGAAGRHRLGRRGAGVLGRRPAWLEFSPGRRSYGAADVRHDAAVRLLAGGLALAVSASVLRLARGRLRRHRDRRPFDDGAGRGTAVLRRTPRAAGGHRHHEFAGARHPVRPASTWRAATGQPDRTISFWALTKEQGMKRQSARDLRASGDRLTVATSRATGELSGDGSAHASAHRRERGSGTTD